MNPISYALIAILGLVSFAAACAAPESKDSPAGTLWGALFLGTPLGAVVFYSVDGYVSLGVAITGLTASRGPFTYRIHNKEPFGACDPRSKDFNPFCGDYRARTPAEMEVGDLSGKHGLISGTSELAAYNDHFLSLNPKNKAFVGKMSVVIEDVRGRRVACAEIQEIASKLVGEEAEAAKPVLKLDVPQHVKDLLV